MAIKKLSLREIKILKIFHIFFTVMWIGGALALVLSLSFLHPTTPEGYHIRSISVRIFDYFLIIPGAIGLLITGLIYGIWTKWGFFKFQWVAVKWIIILAQVILGIIIGLSWIEPNVFAPDQMDNYIIMQETVEHNVRQAIIWGSVQVTGLLVVVYISVVKPWKKKIKRKTKK